MYEHETTTPAERLESLKYGLGRLIFIQVAKVVTRDEDIICFESRNKSTIWDDDPDFEREKQAYDPQQWRWVEKTYCKYFGFTSGRPGVYFHSKNRTRDTDLVGLRLRGSDPIVIPKQGSWIAGILGRLSPESKGPWFYKWQSSTFSEKMFADLLLGRADLTDSNISYLTDPDKDPNGRILNNALILIKKDFACLMGARKTAIVQVNDLDSNVYDICRIYDVEFWNEYKKRALEQGIYSSLIQPPAPKVIRDRRHDDYTPVVGLSTPFGALSI